MPRDPRELSDAVTATIGREDADLVARLQTYLELLERWNERHNLTGFKQWSTLVELGVVDSLTAAELLPPMVPGLDAGSGAGFPVLPLAALDPARRWSLVEPRRKRVSFLTEAARVMELPNVVILRQRLELIASRVPLITSRAVGGLEGKVTRKLQLDGCWVFATTTRNADRMADLGSAGHLAFDARVDSPAEGRCWVRVLRRG